MDVLARNWKLIAVRGLLGILLGIVALWAPLPTLTAIVWIFGAYALIDGIMSLVSVASGNGARPWWMLVLEGIVGIAAGIIAFVWPGITALALVYLVAIWAVGTGILEIAAAVRLRTVIEGEWLLGLTGILSIGFGVLLALAPGVGAVVLVWWLGLYAIVFGGLLLALSYRLRAMARSSVSEKAVPRAA